jgi:hypothetical protein
LFSAVSVLCMGMAVKVEAMKLAVAEGRVVELNKCGTGLTLDTFNR